MLKCTVQYFPSDPLHSFTISDTPLKSAEMVHISSMPQVRLPDEVIEHAIMQKPYDGSITVGIPYPIWFLLVNEGECINDTSEPAEIRRSVVFSHEWIDNTLLWSENVTLPDKLLSCMYFIIHYLPPAYTLNHRMPHLIVDIDLPINPFAGWPPIVSHIL